MCANEFDKKRHIGFICSSIGRDIKEAIHRGACENQMEYCTTKNGWIIGYFVRQQEPIFQKDLEKTFHLPKSTLADMIQTIEKDGLIEKVPVDGDGRKKQIVVTEKGLEFNRRIENQIIEVEEYVTKDISEEEINMVIRVLEKMQQNAREYKSYVELKKED